PPLCGISCCIARATRKWLNSRAPLHESEVAGIHGVYLRGRVAAVRARHHHSLRRADAAEATLPFMAATTGLTELIDDVRAGIDAIGSYLDQLDGDARWREVGALGRSRQRTLNDKAAHAPA